MLVRYMLPSVCLRLRQFSQLSFIQYMGLCVFSLPNSPVMIVRMCTLSNYHHQTEVWIINHCLGLGHENMVCAVCLTMFLYIWLCKWLMLVISFLVSIAILATQNTSGHCFVRPCLSPRLWHHRRWITCTPIYWMDRWHIRAHAWHICLHTVRDITHQTRNNQHYYPAERSCSGRIGFTPSVRLSRPSVCPAARVRFVAPTGLVRSISYLYILQTVCRV